MGFVPLLDQFINGCAIQIILRVIRLGFDRLGKFVDRFVVFLVAGILDPLVGVAAGSLSEEPRDFASAEPAARAVARQPSSADFQIAGLFIFILIYIDTSNLDGAMELDHRQFWSSPPKWRSIRTQEYLAPRGRHILSSPLGVSTARMGFTGPASTIQGMAWGPAPSAVGPQVPVHFTERRYLSRNRAMVKAMAGKPIRLGAHWWVLVITGILFGLVAIFVDLKPVVDENFFFSTKDPQFRQTKKIEKHFPSQPELILAVSSRDIASPRYLDRIKN